MSGKPKARIAVLTCHDKRYEWLYRITSESNYAYTKRHGYDFQVFYFGKLDRPPYWGKILGLKHFLPDYEWVFYLDTDVLFTNPDFKVESYLDENYDCVVGRMPTAKHVSTSGILLRRCDWSFKMLDYWWEQKAYDRWESDSDTTRGGGLYFDQSGFHRLLDTDSEFMSRVKVLPETDKNWNNESWSWREGDWLLHCPGLSLKSKMEMIWRVREMFGLKRN